MPDRHVPIRLLACALLLGAGLPALLSAQTADDHVMMGTAALQASDLRTGLAHYEAGLVADSTDYEANWRTAMALLDLGQQIPDSVRSAERDSLYARAERLASRAIRTDSNGADGHFALAAAVGLASLTKGQKERIRRAEIIREEALRALALNPRHDGAYHILGRWNAEIMRLSGLSRFFAKSFLGAGIFKQASWDEAIADLERAVELDPGRIFHRLELAEIYADRKRWDEARDQLARLQVLPDREVLDPLYRERAAALAARIANKR